MSNLFEKIPFEEIVDEPKKPKGPIQAFFDRWMIVIVCFSLSIFSFGLGIYGKFTHYPEISELRHVAGILKTYSVVDGFRNHRITLELQSGEVFIFQKVSFFPPVKEVLACANKIDLWVDGSRSPEIWQLSINGVTMMSRDANVSAMKGTLPVIFKSSFCLFLAGSAFLVMLKSKIKFVEEKLYPAVLLIIGIISLMAVFYFGFLKGGILGK